MKRNFVVVMSALAAFLLVSCKESSTPQSVVETIVSKMVPNNRVDKADESTSRENSETSDDESPQIGEKNSATAGRGETAQTKDYIAVRDKRLSDAEDNAEARGKGTTEAKAATTRRKDMSEIRIDDKVGKMVADVRETSTSKPIEEKVYTVVEQMPSFPGGESVLMNFIESHQKYPSAALEQGVEGTVMVRFVVTSTGQVGEVQVLRSVSPSLDREAKRVVSSLPKFIPGRQQGRPVSVWYTCPVRFAIE